MALAICCLEVTGLSRRAQGHQRGAGGASLSHLYPEANSSTDFTRQSDMTFASGTKIEGKDTRARLIGVDTPETVHPNNPVECFGKEASGFTKKLLEGQRVTLEYDRQKTDRYKRTLAYVYRVKDGLFVNREIIARGYDHAYTKYPLRAEEDRRLPQGRKGG